MGGEYQSMESEFSVWTWILDNKEWLFSGVGITVLAASWYAIKWKLFSVKYSIPTSEIVQHRTLAELKDVVRILFIDDDTRFKVTSILKKGGWVHTKLIKDINSLGQSELAEAHLVFVDVQGVGKSLAFKEEGLGLAAAIMEKYPDKRTIIYSAETKGDRFHEALKKADSFLAKNADPYEFEKLVEDFAKELEHEGKV